MINRNRLQTRSGQLLIKDSRQTTKLERGQTTDCGGNKGLEYNDGTKNDGLESSHVAGSREASNSSISDESEELDRVRAPKNIDITPEARSNKNVRKLRRSRPVVQTQKLLFEKRQSSQSMDAGNDVAFLHADRGEISANSSISNSLEELSAIISTGDVDVSSRKKFIERNNFREFDHIEPADESFRRTQNYEDNKNCDLDLVQSVGSGVTASTSSISNHSENEVDCAGLSSDVDENDGFGCNKKTNEAFCKVNHIKRADELFENPRKIHFDDTKNEELTFGNSFTSFASEYSSVSSDSEELAPVCPSDNNNKCAPTSDEDKTISSTTISKTFEEVRQESVGNVDSIGGSSEGRSTRPPLNKRLFTVPSDEWLNEIVSTEDESVDLVAEERNDSLDSDKEIVQPHSLLCTDEPDPSQSEYVILNKALHGLVKEARNILVELERKSMHLKKEVKKKTQERDRLMQDLSNLRNNLMNDGLIKYLEVHEADKEMSKNLRLTRQRTMEKLDEYPTTKCSSSYR